MIDKLSIPFNSFTKEISNTLGSDIFIDNTHSITIDNFNTFDVIINYKKDHKHTPLDKNKVYYILYQTMKSYIINDDFRYKSTYNKSKNKLKCSITFRTNLKSICFLY